MKILAVELDEQEIAYILTDVLESNAIGYWAVYTNWKRIHDKENEELDSCVCQIKIQDMEDEKCYTIDAGIIRQGVERIVSGKIAAQHIREMIISEDIDSDGSDCIVQAGLFNEIKYG